MNQIIILSTFPLHPKMYINRNAIYLCPTNCHYGRHSTKQHHSLTWFVIGAYKCASQVWGSSVSVHKETLRNLFALKLFHSKSENSDGLSGPCIKSGALSQTLVVVVVVVVDNNTPLGYTRGHTPHPEASTILAGWSGEMNSIIHSFTDINSLVCAKHLHYLSM